MYQKYFHTDTISENNFVIYDIIQNMLIIGPNAAKPTKCALRPGQPHGYYSLIHEYLDENL